MRRAAIVVGALVIVALVVVLARPFGPATDPIDTAEVVRADLAVTVELAGTLEARASRSLGFGTAGSVAEVRVEAGARVVAGALLARLDTTVLETQLAAAEAALHAAEVRLEADRSGPSDAQLSAAREPVRQAETALVAAKASRAEIAATNDGAVAAAEAALDEADAQLAADQAAGADALTLALDQFAVDLATSALEAATLLRSTALEQADAGVASASAALAAARTAYAARTEPVPDALIAADEAAVANASASVTAATQTLALAELRAPFAGTVVEVGIAAGDRVGGSAVVSLGSSPSPQVITVADLGAFEVTAAASEIDVVALEPDQAVEVTLDALPGTRLAGRLCDIALVGRSDGGVVAFPVTVCLETSDPGLRVGLSANVSIVLESVEDVLVVPTGSIRTVDGRPTVEIVAADGSVRRIEVTLGISNGTRTEVRSGLAEGQRVALRPTSGD